MNINTIFIFFASAGSILLSLLHTISLNSAYLRNLLRNDHENSLPIWTLTDLPDDDDYFYFARIQKIMSGRLLNGDPLLLENASKPHPHCTYQLSLLFCGIFRIFTKSTTIVLFAARLVYPALHTILLIYTFFTASRSLGLSALAALITLNRGGTIYNRARIPNILFTSIHLSLFFILGYLYLSEAPGSLLTLVLALTIAASPVISLLNSVFIIITLIVFCAAHLPDLALHIELIALTVVLSIPTSAFALRAASSFSILRKYGDSSDSYFPISRFKHGIKRQFLNRVLVVLCAHIIFYPTGITGSKLYPLMITISSVICFLIIYFFCTKHKTSIMIERCLTHITTIAAIFCVYLVASPYSIPITSNKLIDGLIFFATTIYAVYLLKRTAKHSIASYHDRHKKELTAWAEGLSDKEIIASLDFYTLLSLPAYTRAWFYIPQLILSSAADDEVWARLYDVCALHGVTQDEFAHFTARLLPYAAARSSENLPYIAAGQYLTYYQYNDHLRTKSGFTRSHHEQGINLATWAQQKITQAQADSQDGFAINWCLPQDVAAQRNHEYAACLKAPRIAATPRNEATLIILSSDAPLKGLLTRAVMEESGAVPLFHNDAYTVYTRKDTTQALASIRNKEVVIA